MIIRKGFLVVVVLCLIAALSGCGKKESEEEAASQEPAKPAVVRGEMVLVPAGEFIMGAKDPKSNASPEHKVNLPAFWIDKYEVTNMDFMDFSAKTGYEGEGVKEGKDWKMFATIDKALVPVVYITWNDAEAYCKSLGKRLPTEEEWEKAARGSDGKSYPWGNEWADGRSNTAETGLLKPMPIGEFDDVSQYGAHDMLGNVREWTGTWYASYPGNPKKEPANKWRVIRGLSPNHKGKMNFLWDRAGIVPAYTGDVGCRCAKDATPEDVAKAAQAK